MRAVVIIGLGVWCGCGDDARSGGDADAGAAEAIDAIDETDAIDEADIGPLCGPGESVAAVAGDDELHLELCGAVLVGAAPAGTEVTLAIVEAPAPFPFEHALVGAAYRISGDGFAGRLAIADSDEPGYRMAATFTPDEGWLGFEACPEEDGLVFPVATGTYALWRDVNSYPASPQDLGSGAITTTFMGDEIAWTFDDGYAIHDAGANGLRSAALIARRTPSEGILQQLDIRLVEAADHTFTVLQVTLIDTSDLSGGWSWLEPVDGPLVGAAVATEGMRISGAFEAPLRKGDAVETMAVELDVETGRYRFPPEGVCFPEG